MDQIILHPTDTIDTIVIGGSAGSFAVLQDIVGALPADLAASVVVCLHQASTGLNRTADLLQRNSRLQIAAAEDNAPLRAGTIYLAVPDKHLLIGSDHLHLRRGAHENNFRPAIDPLFRSAAVFRGPRAVGVILSGLLDDGAAGARALAQTGGRIFVQDPATAEFPEMPESALAAEPSATALEPAEIAEQLVSLAGTPCEPMGEVPWEIGLELKITTLEAATMRNEEKLGTLTPFNCPHCNGVLWEIKDGPMLRYRCHTGHAYTMKSLSAAQDDALDFGLFNALRACRGRAELIRRMEQEAGSDLQRAHFARRAEKFEADAEELEKIISQRQIE